MRPFPHPCWKRVEQWDSFPDDHARSADAWANNPALAPAGLPHKDQGLSCPKRDELVTTASFPPTALTPGHSTALFFRLRLRTLHRLCARGCATESKKEKHNYGSPARTLSWHGIPQPGLSVSGCFTGPANTASLVATLAPTTGRPAGRGFASC